MDNNLCVHYRVGGRLGPIRCCNSEWRAISGQHPEWHAQGVPPIQCYRGVRIPRPDTTRETTTITVLLVLKNENPSYARISFMYIQNMCVEVKMVYHYTI